MVHQTSTPSPHSSTRTSFAFRKGLVLTLLVPLASVSVASQRQASRKDRIYNTYRESSRILICTQAATPCVCMVSEGAWNDNDIGPSVCFFRNNFRSPQKWARASWVQRTSLEVEVDSAWKCSKSVPTLLSGQGKVPSIGIIHAQRPYGTSSSFEASSSEKGGMNDGRDLVKGGTSFSSSSSDNTSFMTGGCG